MSDLFGIEDAAKGLKQSVKAGQSLQDSMGDLLKFAQQVDKSRYNATLKGKKVTSDAQQALSEFQQKKAVKEMEANVRKQILEKYGKDGLNDFEHIMADIAVRRKKAEADAKNQRIAGKLMLWAGIILGLLLVWYVEFHL